jgi:spore maturation protein SpmA
MLNYVWSFLLLTGLVAGALFGRLGLMVSAVFDVCKAVVLDIALPLAGTMMLWLGILRVMEKAGLMQVLARMMSPILRRLFPDVPADHPAMGAMLMNIAANMLGLGNSATPLGLKAMSHLHELNPTKQSASNAMCMFLALNTAGFTLIPMSAINFLNAGGVKNPFSIIAPTLFATFCAMSIAILSAKLLQRLPIFRALPDQIEASDATASTETTEKAFQPSVVRKALITITALAFALGVYFEFAPKHREVFLKSVGLAELLQNAAQKKLETEQRATEIKAQKAAAPVSVASAPQAATWRETVQSVSVLAIPMVLLVTVLWALAKGIPVYEEMVEGAKEGFGVATRIMPFLVVMLTALKLFSESGALMLLQYFIQPVLNLIHMPAELFPLAVMRPLSGSGSQGILNEIILNPAASAFLKYTAAIMYGSTETTFYVLAVYFGSVGIRRIRHALAVGLIADVVGMVCAITAGRLLFG